jgi:hypothetical protein
MAEIEAVYKKEPHFEHGEWKKGSFLIIHRDDDPQDPRADYDNFGHMACYHRDYRLGDKKERLDPKVVNSEDYESLQDYLEKERDAEILLPLYLLDHSGLWIRTGRYACDPGGWDTSMVGYIYCTKKEIEREWGTGPDAYEKAEACLESEVGVYNDYLTGNVHGFETEAWDDEDCIDSCWGYIGNYEDYLQDWGYSPDEEIPIKDYRALRDAQKDELCNEFKEFKKLKQEGKI